MATYTTTPQHPPHTTIHFFILIGFNIQKHFLRRLVTCAIKYCTKPTCQNLYYYTHARFTCHHTLLHTTIFLHHTDLIQKYIPSCRIIFPLVESEKSWFKHQFQVPMYAYTLDVLSWHQRNILFLFFARDFDISIEHFLLRSHIPSFSHIIYIYLHATFWGAYYLFLSYLQVLPH